MASFLKARTSSVITVSSDSVGPRNPPSEYAPGCILLSSSKVDSSGIDKGTLLIEE
jgi:hypothetical protein